VTDAHGSPEESFSGKRAAEIVKISYRQLDYWARTDLIRPSVADAHGSGSRRRYSYRDLIELKLIKTLLDNGIKLENVRQAFQYVRDQLGEDLSSA
jgi:DNA-binding transcriptional MerR regulator